jgi:hypothetical protein
MKLWTNALIAAGICKLPHLAKEQKTLSGNSNLYLINKLVMCTNSEIRNDVFGS